MNMNEQHLLLNEAAHILGKKPYQITYAITSGAVADVMRIGGRRIFQADDIQRLAQHFRLDLKSWDFDADCQRENGTTPSPGEEIKRNGS